MTSPISQPQSHVVQFGSKTIEFELVFEDRRLLKIDVHPNGRVVAHAPKGKTLDAVGERIRKRATWILRQLDYFEQFQPLPPSKQYVSGETHYYLGRQYRLKVIEDRNQRVKLIGRYLHAFVSDPSDKGKVAERLQLWHRQHARRIFAQRTEQCFAKLKNEGVPFPEVKLRRMPTRWGSYSRPGTILLNPELIKTPLYCIEYVIMHELCHLKHPNHGRGFYRLLTRCMPDWERRKSRLELAIL